MSNIHNLCNNFNPSMDNGLIIFADISGFTNYINISEIEHSQKNIARLLEALIDANELDLNVSEIEGDAIFFFTFESDISFLGLINQIRRMAHHFYSTLADLSSDMACKCGACSVLADLHIKFIVHTGNIGTIMIKDFCKLYGIDIIVAHKLLKNNVPIDDYILFTSKIIQKYETEMKKVFQLKNFTDKEGTEYNHIGRIEYLYFPINTIVSGDGDLYY